MDQIKNPTSANPFTLQPRKMRVELLKLAASNHIFKEIQLAAPSSQVLSSL